MLGVDAGRGRIEDAPGIAPPAGFENVEVDLRRVVHDVGVVLAGEDVAGSPHEVGSRIMLEFYAIPFLAHWRGFKNCYTGHARLPMACIRSRSMIPVLVYFLL